MHTGEKIRNLRLLKGLSQENIAKDLGISRVAYSDIERGKTDLTESRIKQIADVLDVSPDDIHAFDSRVNYFFENCKNANANISTIKGNNHNEINHYEDAKDLQHQLEKLQLELKLEKIEKEKALLEATYWKEKAEGKV